MADTFREARPDEITNEELVGSGRFGRVYRALWHGSCPRGDPGDGEIRCTDGDECATAITVAIKRTDCSRDEAIILAHCSHRNVLKLLAAHVSSKGEGFLVTEYCDGGSLYDFLSSENNGITAARRFEWTHQVLPNCVISVATTTRPSFLLAASLSSS